MHVDRFAFAAGRPRLFVLDFHRLIQIDLDPASVTALSGNHADEKAVVGAGGSRGLAHDSESVLLLAAAASASTPTPTPRRRHRAATGDANGVNGGDNMGAGGEGGGKDQSDLLLASVSRAAVKLAAADLRRHVSQVLTSIALCKREMKRFQSCPHH